MQTLVENGGHFNMRTLRKLKMVQAEPNRLTEIEAILAMTRVARDDASNLGLKFETYLLGMAALALSEQLTKHQVETPK